MHIIKNPFVMGIFVFLFFTGFDLGKSYEARKNERAVNLEKIQLTKKLKKAIEKSEKYKIDAANLRQNLKLDKKAISKNVKKITQNNNCINMGNNWRIMHNGVIERFKSFKGVDRRD